MRASLHFHGALNDFLAPKRRNVDILYAFETSGSIKDAIESLRVPHPEVCTISVNNKQVNFSYLVQNLDTIQVYPHAPGRSGESICLSGALPSKLKFVLDTHLGTLTGNLRLLGFDSLYRNDYADEELAHISACENRILLTRDIGLLKRSLVVHGYFVRPTHTHKQLEEIVHRFDLAPLATPFTRCIRCNGQLKSAAKEDVIHKLPERVAANFNDFTQCDLCGRVYWEGSHVTRMRQLLDQVLKPEKEEGEEA